MGGQKDSDEIRKLKMLLESDYYNSVLDAWFIALKKAGGVPERIKKKYLLEDGGILNHQRFNHHFRNLDTLYEKTRIKFAYRVKQVAHDYHHQYLEGYKLWEAFLDAVKDCPKESKMALIRDDRKFFRKSLDQLQEYFEASVCESGSESRAYQYCLEASVGIVMRAVAEWDSLSYNEQAKAKIAGDLARLEYALDHPLATFSKAIR